MEMEDINSRPGGAKEVLRGEVEREPHPVILASLTGRAAVLDFRGCECAYPVHNHV